MKSEQRLTFSWDARGRAAVKAAVEATVGAAVGEAGVAADFSAVVNQ